MVTLFYTKIHSEFFIFLGVALHYTIHQIKKHFGISLNYLSFNDIYFLLNKYFPKIYTLNKEYILTFPTPFDSLKHLKNTGVTGFNKTVDIKKIRTFTSTELTYKTACFYAKK